MAKKQTADATETAEAKPGDADAGNKEAKGEPKKRAPKAKPGADASPAVPVAETAVATAPEASGGGGTKVVGPSEKKRSKKPGIAPARGKKLRNQLRNQRQKIEKEGNTTLKKAVSVLKTLKRAKFDETVEIHMSLGVDTTQS